MVLVCPRHLKQYPKVEKLSFSINSFITFLGFNFCATKKLKIKLVNYKVNKKTHSVGNTSIGVSYVALVHSV